MSMADARPDIDAPFNRMISASPGETLGRFTEPRRSVSERKAAGKSLRKTVPRESHSLFREGADRPDPVAILEAQNLSRVQKLVPVRFARMLASPFAFLRGSAAVMASDLATTPVTGIQVNACGDMHVSNFGVFGSAERDLVFAINDFDEVFPGPWEWDLKRLTASAAVAVRFMGGDKHQAAEAAAETVRSYREHVARYAEMGHLATWYDRIDEHAVLSSLSPQARKNARKLIEKARAKGHQRVLGKLAELVEGEHRIVESVPLVVRESHTDDGTPIEQALDAMLNSYLESLTYDRRRLLSRYRIIDVARKVVGVGSVGTGCWVVLLMGNDGDDPLFLQVKQAQPSVLAAYSDYRMPFENHGRRVVVGQRMIQGSPDIFLGWGQLNDRDFYVRQLADMKGGIEMEEGNTGGIAGFLEYCALCGWALALAHAKSGDAAAIAGYCGNSAALDEAIARFSLAYARQTERDHETLDKARRTGRIRVASERLAK
ncbi:MAG: hypothetical protein FD144_880 [Rhodospirillaceae bacterium]|nr:MAG: hypothetical protein FD144_880 [Rhodospirillaceae bacterium]